jgi:hypothetical protein
VQIARDAKRPCRMHGGPSAGAPKGKQNAFKHGRYTAEAMARRRELSALLQAMRTLAGEKRFSPNVTKAHEGEIVQRWPRFVRLYFRLGGTAALGACGSATTTRMRGDMTGGLCGT